MKSPTPQRTRGLREITAALFIAVLLLGANAFASGQPAVAHDRALAPADTDTTEQDTVDTLGFTARAYPDIARADTDTTEQDTVDTLGVQLSTARSLSH